MACIDSYLVVRCLISPMLRRVWDNRCYLVWPFDPVIFFFFLDTIRVSRFCAFHPFLYHFEA